MKCEVVDPDGLLNQLKFLKFMNVDGVVVDCWWGIVEAHINGYFKWCVSLSSSYRFVLFETFCHLLLLFVAFFIYFENKTSDHKVGLVNSQMWHSELLQMIV